MSAQNNHPAIVEETDQDIMDWLDQASEGGDVDEAEGLDWLNGDGTDECEESSNTPNFAELIDLQWSNAA